MKSILFWLRLLAVGIALNTLFFLVLHARHDGVRTLFFLPDIVVSAALVIAAAHGGRSSLIAAYAANAGVFLTASLGTFWTEGLAATPAGASLGVVVCAAAIFALMRFDRASNHARGG